MSSSMATSEDIQQNNKRRKICTDITTITDLDDEAIRHVAIFLPKTSRALLAVALTTESSKWNDIEWNKSSTPSILSLVSTYLCLCGVHILCIYIALTTVY